MKTLTHVWSLVCSRSILDQDTNNISIINAIEKITVPISEEQLMEMKQKKADGFIFPIEFQVVSRFFRLSKGSTAFDYKVTLLNPEKKATMVSERKIALNQTARNLRVRTNFASLPASISGDYVILIEVRDVGEERYQTVSEIPLEIAVGQSVVEK